MDVDNVDSWSNNPPDSGKFLNLKSFVAAAREFEATHSETAVNLMTRYLGLISSSCDLSVFSPGRSEVCAFFSSLWRVMCDGRGPHWAGVAVLARACLEPSAKHALTHTYKFLPILSRLLSDSISNEKKIKLLSIMQDISYGIKISWQESYLPSLMKQLTEWITQPIGDPQQKTIGHISLTVLVNICYGNLPAIYALMRTVDTKDFVVHLINLKDGGYGGVVVCRLLLCLTGATRGAAATRQADVHSYLCCTMKTFKKAIAERDTMQLLHSCTFMNDLIADDNFKSFVLTYPHFNSIADNLQDAEALCKAAGDDSEESELSSSCLRHALKFLTLVIGLDLYSLRVHHCEMVRLCIKSSRVCLPESLQFFAAIVTQYRDEGRLPKELIEVIGEGLPGMLVAPALEPGTAGLQWLQVVGALCESSETQDHVLRDVTPDAFEDTLYSVLEHATQNGEMGNESGQMAASVGCRVALTLAPLNRQWEAALNRLLAHHQVRRLLCAGVTSSNGARRKSVLQLIKHHYFPSEQLTQVFGADMQAIAGNVSSAGSASGEGSMGSMGVIGTGCICDAQQQFVTPAHERAIDALLAHLTQQLNENKISNVATSSVMELYGYKINNLEQRLHSHTVALQGASEQMASLQHALAMLQATNSSQQDVLYATQMQNEKHKKMVDEMHQQLEEAEKAVRGFRVKVAAEKLDKERQKEILQNEFKSQILNIENEMKCRERAAEERVRKAEEETNAMHKKLEQLNAKNNELAGVLIKFEERVKQRDKRLEEGAATEAALKREIDSKEHNIKELKKTVVERETRLYQVVAQLEEMKRVQEMVAKLMSKSAATPT